MDSNRESTVLVPAAVETAQKHSRMAHALGTHNNLHVGQRTRNKRTMFFWAENNVSIPYCASIGY
jgi:hypothetical protein